MLKKHPTLRIDRINESSFPMLRYLSLLALSILPLLGLVSCSDTQKPAPPTTTQQLIAGRGDRSWLYRANVPANWIRRDPSPKDSLRDSKKPLCEFFIEEKTIFTSQILPIKIAIHNFPIQSREEQILPAAQMARWKEQLQPIDPTSLCIEPQAFGGFVGYQFKATGIQKIAQKETPQTTLAWIMQLAPEHWNSLIWMADRADIPQWASNFTIKATGSPEQIEKYEIQIRAFARSFELIEEIPTLP